MNETRRDAHLRRVALARRSATEEAIVQRLTELIHQGIDPASRSVPSVLVGGGAVSRATYFRNRHIWTWEFLLGDLLPARRPASAGRLAMLRGEISDPESPGLKRMIETRPMLFAASARRGDEADLRHLLEWLLDAAEGSAEDFVARPPYGDEQDGIANDLMLSETGSSLARVLSSARDRGEEDWNAAVEVLSKCVSALAGVDQRLARERNLLPTPLERQWVYCMVRSGRQPRKAVETVLHACPPIQAAPDDDRYQFGRWLWTEAAVAILDGHSDVRTSLELTPAALKDLDEHVLRRALRCAESADAAMKRDYPEVRIFCADHAARLLSALSICPWTQHASAWKHLNKALRDVLTSREAEALPRFVGVNLLLARDGWLIATGDPNGPACRAAAEDFITVVLDQTRYVGGDGGVSMDLSGLGVQPPALLLTAEQMLQGARPDLSDGIRDLLERVRSTRKVYAWGRIDRQTRQAWFHALRDAPPHLRLIPVRTQIARLTGVVADIEGAFASGASITKEEIDALGHALTCLTTARDQVADAGLRISGGPHWSDAGTPFAVISGRGN